MSAWTNGTYTRKGLALLAKLTQGSSLKITRGVSGTGYVKPEVLADQTAVIGVKQTLDFKAASYPEAGTCKLPVYLTNDGLAAGYKAKQIGLYANDPDEGEILYFIAQSETGTDVPGATEMPDYSATWTFYFQYGQADNVSVTVDPSHTITEDMLEEVRIIAERGVSVAKEGTAIRNDNAAALSFAGLRLFGKTTQEGVSTPEVPAVITTVSPSKVTVCGKNILPYPYEEGSMTRKGVTFTVNSDGTIKVSGTSTGAYILIATAANKQLYLCAGESYWFSLVPEGGDMNTYYAYVHVGEKTYFDTGDGVLVEPEVSGYASVTAVVKEGTTVDGLILRPQVECGYKASGYEPYKVKEISNIRLGYDSLNGIPVDFGGNYTDANGQQWLCDEIDFARGVYIKRVKWIVLDGSESFNITKNHTSENRYLYCVNALGIDTTISGRSICDKLQYNTSNKMNEENANTVEHSGYSASNSYGVLYLNMGYLMTENTVEAFRAMLSESPLTFYCALKTPEEWPLTEDMLDWYCGCEANNPTTTVINDAGAWMEVDLIEAQHEKGLKAIQSRETWNGKPVLVKQFEANGPAIESAGSELFSFSTGIPPSATIVDISGICFSEGIEGDSAACVAYQLPFISAAGIVAFVDIQNLLAISLPDRYDDYTLSVTAGPAYGSTNSTLTGVRITVKYTL